MARTTTNYGYNISEGTDLVNPLTDIFPNFEEIDTDLKEVSDAAVGSATELKTGTVHALTRSDTDRDIFTFTATANFTAGDTFTVDSVQVTALTTSGEALTTGCYIIGSEVLCSLKGTLLTVYTSQVVTNATTLDGHAADYFATASDLQNTDGDVSALSTKVGSAVLTTNAQDCSGAINEINANLFEFKFTSIYSSSGEIPWGSVAVSDISGYKAIAVSIGMPTDICNPSILPMSLFKTNCTSPSTGFNSVAYRSGNMYQAGTYYIDNTHIGVMASTGGRVYVWGVN